MPESPPEPMDLPDPSISVFDGPSWIDYAMVIGFLAFIAGLIVYLVVST